MFYIQECFAEHQANLDMDDPRDLIDEYLIEMKKQEEAGEDPTFSLGGKS